MVQRIYTKTGDAGETGLFGGGRVSKADPRVEAYGAVDELNAALGWALAVGLDPSTELALRAAQSDLFTIGAHLATPPGRDAAAAHLPPLPEARITEWEQWMDQAEAELPELRTFILPGGAAAAAALHTCRTVCRRAERRTVALAADGEVHPVIIVYLNRLSDLLFVAARRANAEADVADVAWEPRMR
jgi:cob(I)alamin adenosyltransferase